MRPRKRQRGGKTGSKEYTGVNRIKKINLQSKLIAKLTVTCSKSTIETLEKGVKYVQS